MPLPPVLANLPLPIIGSPLFIVSNPKLVIAQCTVDYVGRLTAHLPSARRLLLIKADGSVSVHADAAGIAGQTRPQRRSRRLGKRHGFSQARSARSRLRAVE